MSEVKRQDILLKPLKAMGFMVVVLFTPIIYLICPKEYYPAGIKQCFEAGLCVFCGADVKEYYKKWHKEKSDDAR